MKDVGLLRSKAQCNTCSGDTTWSAHPIFLRDFVGDVAGRSLGLHVPSRNPSSTDLGSSRVISPSRNFFSFLSQFRYELCRLL